MFSIRPVLRRLGFCSVLLAMLVPLIALSAAGEASAASQTISGTVLRQGAPLSGSVVAFNANHERVQGATVQGDGSFAMLLAAGDYVLQFQDGGDSKSQYYGGTTSWPDAQRVTVLDQPVSLGTVNWVEGGSVTASMRTVAGQGAEGSLSYFRDDGSGYKFVGDSYAVNGNFDIALDPGSYKFRFEPVGYPARYYPSGTSLSGALAIKVVSSQVSLDPMTFAPPATVAGRITDAAGKPLPRIDVLLLDYWGDLVDWDSTDAGGGYSFSSVPKASGYTVLAQDNGDELYADAITASFSAPITGTVTVPDLKMKMRATISGRVANASGMGLGHVEVSAYDDYEVWQAEATTDAAGNYTLKGLRPGAYRLRFEDVLGEYQPQWYAGRSSIAGATRVSLTTDQNVTGKDAQLAVRQDQPVGVDLQGTVKGTGGALVAGVSVCAFRDGDQTPAECVFSGRTGHYAFTDLASGSYRVSYVEKDPAPTDLGHVRQWYPGAPTRARAQSIDLTADNPGVARDVTMVQFGAVEGHVSDYDGMSITGGYVEAFNLDGDSSGVANIDGGGVFSLPLAPGSYRLLIVGWREVPGGEDQTFVREWYSDVRTMDRAEILTVFAGQRTEYLQVGLTQDLQAYVAPQVSGAPVVGRTLRASSGEFNLMTETTLSYQWLRGATVVGTGRTYVPTLADAGRRLQVRVTARNHDRTGQATSLATGVVKSFSSTALAAKSPRKATVRVAATVSVRGIAGLTGGTVTIVRGTKTVKWKVPVVNGKAVATLTKQPKGTRNYRAVYSGIRSVLHSTSPIRVAKVR